MLNHRKNLHRYLQPVHKIIPPVTHFKQVIHSTSLVHEQEIPPPISDNPLNNNEGCNRKILHILPYSRVGHRTARSGRAIECRGPEQKIAPPLFLVLARYLIMDLADPMAIIALLRAQHHNLSTEIPSSYGMKRIHVDREIDPRKTGKNSTHCRITY
jgi:hypothetical protein